MGGVSTAPNRATIEGRVERVEPSSSSVGKWYITVAVSAASAIEGGLFARVGEEARVFTFGDAPPVQAGSTVRAEVEYLGGPTGGEFRLVRLVASSTTSFVGAAPHVAANVDAGGAADPAADARSAQDRLGDVPEPTDQD